jgi:hypothetical protein
MGALIADLAYRQNSSYSDFKLKLHPCSFDLAAAAKALFRLAAFSEKNCAPDFSSSKKKNNFNII